MRKEKDNMYVGASFVGMHRRIDITVLKKEKQNGITLIALVITIIVLLILVGIVLNLTLGENGIIKLAQKASENYIQTQNEEKTNLNELYSSMMIATGDNAQITISMEDLKKIIQEEIKKERQLNGQRNVLFSGSASEVKTYDMDSIKNYKYLLIYAGCYDGGIISQTQLIEVDQIEYGKDQQFTLSAYAYPTHYWRISYQFDSDVKFNIRYISIEGWEEPRIYRIIGIN